MDLALPSLTETQCSKKERGDLDSIARSWVGTPYMEGASTKGVGVDCYHFVVHCLDEWLGQVPTDLRFNRSRGKNDPIYLSNFIGALAERVRMFRVFEEPKPNDVAVMRVNGVSFHVGIVTGSGVWHATRRGVELSSVQSLNTGISRIHRVYRHVDYAC